MGTCRNRAGAPSRPRLAASVGQCLCRDHGRPAGPASLQGTAYKARPSISVFRPLSAVVAGRCLRSQPCPPPVPGTGRPRTRRAEREGGIPPRTPEPGSWVQTTWEPPAAAVSTTRWAVGAVDVSGRSHGFTGPSTLTYLRPETPAGPGEGRGGPAHPPGKPW